MTRKHNYNGDSGKSMGLKSSGTAASRHFGFGVIGRVLYPVQPPSNRKVLTLAVRAAVAEMKK